MRALIIGGRVSGNDLTDGSPSGLDIVHAAAPEAVVNAGAVDVVIDLGFEPTEGRLAALRAMQPAVVIINSVVHTLEETDRDFVRINAWPGFLRGKNVEAGALNEDARQKAQAFFSLLNKEVAWLPDAPGFVTPRVISAIINEAFLALEEGVSTKAEIDTAMKLGTNYPYGPFEWTEKIGVEKIHALLQRLSQDEPRYTPAPSLSSSV